jgi:hypothetical protein
MRGFLLAMLLAGCTVGVDNIGNGGGGDDGSGRGGDVTQPDAGTADVDASSASGADAAVFACRDQVAAGTLSNGHHNPGQDCMNGCHNHGFTLAGTLYTTAAGGTPVKGGNVTVVDANGQTFDVVSQQNGNFYTTKPVTFPVKVTASLCPDIKPMSATIPSGSGGCNKTGCHTAAAAGRVHVP